MRPWVTPRTLTVEVSSILSTCDRESPGRRLMTKAAVPATTGVANDVPHHQVQRIGPVDPVYAQPGAATLTHVPRLDQLYRRSVLLVAADADDAGKRGGVELVPRAFVAGRGDDDDAVVAGELDGVTHDG